MFYYKIFQGNLDSQYFSVPFIETLRKIIPPHNNIYFKVAGLYGKEASIENLLCRKNYAVYHSKRWNTDIQLFQYYLQARGIFHNTLPREYTD